MSKRRTTRTSRNTRLTSPRQQRMKYFVLTKRGESESWENAVRAVRIAIRILFLAAICGGLYIGGTRGWKKLFWENPDYYLKEITYSTDGSLSREHALAATSLQTGKNIFSYNLDHCRQALRKLPQVEQAVVRRYLPNRIELHLTERRPIAWLLRNHDDPVGSDGSYMLDARGLVFKPKRILPEQEVLPVIYGVETCDLVSGNSVVSAEMIASLQLLKSVAENPSIHINSIDVSKGYCIIAHDQNRRKITFGLDHIQTQLERLKSVADEVAKMGQEIDSVNLMLERNIPVIFASVTPTLDPKLDPNIPDPAEPPKAEVIRLPDSTDPAKRTDSPKPAKENLPGNKPGQKPKVTKPFRIHA